MQKKRYALVGTGSRAGMFLEALATTYREVAELVALCDLSQTRMDWYKGRLEALGASTALPTYHAEQFDKMIADTRPDTVIVTTTDRDHHLYIVRAMELGCDVISEKPMTTDVAKMRAIFGAIERTGRRLRVTFNYRYSPAFTRFRELIRDGYVGKPLSVDFSWLLDTSHGADYFRRWHREKENSGGLLVHKATHHFDLVNWWLDSRPKEVMAMGDLLFYGRKNAEARGERYPYARYTGVPEAKRDPFALDLRAKAVFEGLYLNAEAETGYLRRPQRLWRRHHHRRHHERIGTLQKRRAALLSPRRLFALGRVARGRDRARRGGSSSPSSRASTTSRGTGGLRVRGESAGASKGPYKRAELRHYPMFGQAEDIGVPVGEGGHGGADPLMLEQLFSPTPPPDPFHRAASHVDGAASALVGIAANRSMETGRLVAVNELFPLPGPRPGRGELEARAEPTLAK